MKILYIFTFDYSLKTWKNSGILDREIEYFNELKKNNIDITLITYGDASDEKFAENYGLNIYPLYKHFKRPNLKILRVLKSFIFPIYIKKNTEFDIIKQNQLQGAWVSILLKMLTRKKLIIRTGYDVFLFSLKEKKQLYKKVLIYILTQLSIVLSDIYTVTSLDDKKFLEKYYISRKNKIRLRRNWVKFINSLNILENRNHNSLISAGRLEKQKNYIQLLDFLKDSTKKIIIYGNGSQKNNILNYANLNNLEVEIREPIKNNDLIELMRNYTYYVSTSLYEGNPKTILEAMGAGCIVVAPNTQNNKEVIDNKINGYLYDIQTESPLDFLIDDYSEDREMISKNAFETIKNNYSLEKFIEDELVELNEI